MLGGCEESEVWRSHPPQQLMSRVFPHCHLLGDLTAKKEVAETLEARPANSTGPLLASIP